MFYGITRYNPAESLTVFQEDLDRFLEGFWYPAADLEETQREVIVRLELPGLNKGDIQVQVEGGTLAVTGERRREEESKDKKIHWTDRSYGKFQRTVELPGDVSASSAQAEYAQGVLTIRLPKVEQAKPKEIAIEVK